jgi:hypothetical protein
VPLERIVVRPSSTDEEDDAELVKEQGQPTRGVALRDGRATPGLGSPRGELRPGERFGRVETQAVTIHRSAWKGRSPNFACTEF